MFDTDNQAVLISIAFFLALFLFSLGIANAFRQRSVRRQLIGKIRGGGIALDPIEDNEADESKKKGGSPVTAIFAKIGRHMPAPKAEDYSASRLKFLRAGIRKENALSVYWGIKIFLTVFSPVIFLLLRNVVHST